MVVKSDDPTVNSLGGIITSLANAIQIQVFNAIYYDMAVKLTEKEVHVLSLVC